MCKELRQVATLRLTPTRPFHFDATVYKPDHYPTGDTHWEPGTRWQTMLWRGQPLGLVMENRGTPNAPRVLLRIYSHGTLPRPVVAAVGEEIGYRFNLHLDLTPFYKRCRSDPQAGPAIRRLRGLRPMHAGSLYEHLVIAILLQNTTVRRSAAMMEALFRAYGTEFEFAGRRLWCFWEPQALAQASETELRQLKVGYRAKSLLRMSRSFASGEVDELALRQETQAHQEHALLGLYGIGPASVGYIMFDVFHRWDHLQHVSPWEQRVYMQLFFGKDADGRPVPVGRMLKRFADAYGPYEALAVHYVWEDLWWRRQKHPIPWLERLIRL